MRSSDSTIDQFDSDIREVSVEILGVNVIDESRDLILRDEEVLFEFVTVLVVTGDNEFERSH